MSRQTVEREMMVMADAIGPWYCGNRMALAWAEKEKEGGGVMGDVLWKGRDACYKARDAFYACVEKQADKTPSEIATGGLLFPAHCSNSRAAYVSACRPSWVRHSGL